MKKSFKMKAISLLLCVLLATSGIVPAFSAYAAGGVIDEIEMEIFFSDTDTMVPTYQEGTSNEYIVYMKEGETLQLKYKLIESLMPDNAYAVWSSGNPVLVDTDQNGLVKAFDSSKGAVIRSWIDNEVKTIPLIGGALGKVFEKIFFNEYVNLDSMDTEEIVDLMVSALGSESWIADYIEAYQGKLIDSLREYLDKVNTPIYCRIYAADGSLLAEDHINVTVQKNEEWYSDFLPNGTHITNKSFIPTTQAVGNTVQLYAITTPQRLGYGTVYSVKSSSIFSSGKVVATVTDGGLVTFKNKGKVTILVSPDSEQVIAGLLKFINYFYTLQNTGTLNTDQIAKIMIEYMGLDINRAVLAGMLDVAFAVGKVVEGTADPVQLTATAVEIVANIILQMKYNDSITFNVVDSEPITNFDIEGATTVKEGSQIQLSIANVQPSTGNTNDITWTSSNPSVASVDKNTGIITGLDAGGALGQLSSQQCTITATSAANNVSKSVTVTVTGKTGNFISGVDINGSSTVEIGGSEKYSYTVYPSRVANSQNLYTEWGIQTGVDEEGNPEYIWATEEEPAQNEIASITSKGEYTALDGGTATIAVKAYTGYYLSNGRFFEISSHTATKDVSTGIPVDKIDISVTGVSNRNGKLSDPNIVNIEGTDYTYVTVTRSGAYMGNGAVLKANVYPESATNQTLDWVVDNSYYKTEPSDDTHTLTVSQKANHEVADTFNVYAVSNDGRVVSNVITVCVTNNNITGNVIDQDVIELTNYGTGEATHTTTFEGSLTGSNLACKKANWYSSDETVFTVEPKNDDNGNARLTAVDVGEATLYCVSADGGIKDTAKVIVKPNKEYLKNIIDLCEKTSILRTNDNKKLYQQYMRKLDLAYSVYYDQEMASQTTCDTYAQSLLTAFYKLGGFVSVERVNILGTSKKPLKSDFVTVSVGSVSNYKNYSYDFDYEIIPNTSMYSEVKWSSSNTSKISVDENGKCTPVENDPCSSVITCTITDYMGNTRSDSVYISFTRNPIKGISLNYTELLDQKVGEQMQLSASFDPSNASCKDLIWSSSDEKVATVDQNGLVSYVYGGDCEITCTSVDGGYTAVCRINVVTNYDSLKNLIQQYTDLNLTEQSYYPESWAVFTEVMDEAKAMVDGGGRSQKEVDAMYAKLKEAYNQLQRYNYMTDIDIYIDGEPSSDFYQYDAAFLKEGISYLNASLDLNVRLYPNNASYEKVEWASSTSEISVTTEGVASPTINDACYGRITCTVTDHFGNAFSDSVWVSFAYFPVTALKLSDTNITGAVGATYQLACTVEPTGDRVLHLGAASIKDIYWESDDESVATIDENGMVSFVGAGSTIVRAVSYDGGIYAECTVSTEGDRSALKQAIETYKDIDYKNYEYIYGQTFKSAYESAVNALTDLSLSQAEIDQITENVCAAAEEMLNHPFIGVESFVISYKGYSDPTIGSDKLVDSGTVGDNDSLSINLSTGDYRSNNSRNYLDLSASVLPGNASYKSISWSVINSGGMESENNSGAGIRLRTSSDSSAGWAKIAITATDEYERTATRTINVVMADKLATSFTIRPSSLTLFATQSATSLQYTFGGSPEVTVIDWSSNDESVATVDANGRVTPVEKGEAIITAESVDGGFTASATITVETDFSELAEKVSEYKALIESVQHDKVYTEESLNVLAAAVVESEEVVKLGIATQAEVNSYLETLVAAYNSLVKYIAPTGVEIIVDGEQNGVSEPNKGFVRMTSSNSILTNKKIQLAARVLPDDESQPIYESITWESSSSSVSVDETGLVTNISATGNYAVITCTVTGYDGESYSSSIYVSFVRYGATAVTFDDDMIYGAPQQTKKLNVNLNQEDTSALAKALCVNDCLFSSSDEGVATVDEQGNITFLTQGTSVITVTAIDGGYVGTINAYTTWDTTALQEAIAQAEAITYTDYAYEQGTALVKYLEEANNVMRNVYAPQSEIDEACRNLQEAITNLEGHDFISPSPSITIDGAEVIGGKSYPVDSNKQLTVSYTMNNGAMIKSAEWTTENAEGATAKVSGNDLILTKTRDENASITVKLVTIDDYDRTDEFSYVIKLVDSIINVSAISLTADGEPIENNTVSRSGYSIGYSNFSGIQLGYVIEPAGATDPVSVEWKSSSERYITVDSNGFVNLTSLGKLTRTNTATITCTVTNSDGSTVSASVNVEIAR